MAGNTRGPSSREALSKLFTDPRSWEEEIGSVYLETQSFQRYEGRLCSNAATLFDGLSLNEKLAERVEKVYAYAQMNLETDSQSNEAMLLFTRSERLVTDVQVSTSFVMTEIMDLTADEVAALVSEDPRLEKYEGFFAELLKKVNTSHEPEVEELIDSLEGIGYDFERTHRSLLIYDARYPAVTDPDGVQREITISNFRDQLKNADRPYRRQVYLSVYETLRQYSRTLTANYYGSLKLAQRISLLRDKKSLFESVLEKDKIDFEIFTIWIETVRNHLSHVHRFYDVRTLTLGLDSFTIYDQYIPLVPKQAWQISLEEAREILREAVAPLGADYQTRMMNAFDFLLLDEHVQVEYSINVYQVHPYVVMNYKGTLPSLLILAHELGHAVQMQLSNQSRPYVLAEAPALPAEFAALVNELLVLQYLLKTDAMHESKQAALETYLEKNRHMLYRTTMITEFEFYAHQVVEAGEHFSSDDLFSTYRELQQAYFGLQFEVDDWSGYDWTRVLHLYTPFYSYSYPISFALAIAFTKRLLEQGAGVASDYLAFLSAGSDMHFSSMLKLCDEAQLGAGGVFALAFVEFEQLLAELEKRLCIEVDSDRGGVENGAGSCG